VAKLDPRAKMIAGRKVKILATVGPASREPEMLEKLFRAGADAFRVNMSHGEHAIHAETIANIRALEKKMNRPITILCDLSLIHISEPTRPCH
jgi:pyruvate kinase